MRTTLDLDPKLLEDVVKATGQKSKTKAVNSALQDYVRWAKIGELRAMAGRIRLDDTREEQRTADLRRQASLNELRDR
jgi:Arc/MetJ family transcription regulator